MDKALVVVSRYSWLARELQTGTDLPVYSDLGFDVPDKWYPVSYWMPTEHAAAMSVAGISTFLSSPGPNWARGADSVTRREIVMFKAGDIENKSLGLSDGFYKMAEVKHPNFEAGWRNKSLAKSQIKSLQLPKDSLLLYTPTKLELHPVEWRAYVSDYEVMSIAPYSHDHTVDTTAAVNDVALFTDAFDFAQYAADGMNVSCLGYTLDVGYDRTLGWVVIEANPAWSSNPYGNDPLAVVDTIQFSNMFGGYNPDPYLIKRAKDRPRLKKSRPAWADKLEAGNV